MTIQPFGHQPLQLLSHRQRGISDLVLDGNVKDGMQLLAWKADSRASMIFQYEVDPFLFVQRKPLLRTWLSQWIILTDRSVRFRRRRSGAFRRRQIDLVQSGW